MDGVALPLVYEDEDGKLNYNTDVAERILGHEDVINRKVAVIAITGSERGGKSFLLNYILRYLANEGNIDPFGDPDLPLNGFPFMGGRQRHTRGILIWSKAFIRRLDNGEEIAIIILDTQGIFGKSTTNDALIFAFCAFVSSMQIYNARSEFLSNGLEYLDILFRYAKNAFPSEISKVFQKLVILVRDWSLDEQFGFAGGNEYVSELLMVNNDIASQFEACFYEDVSCYLMCNPGYEVCTSKFMGSFNELRELFKEHLIDFIQIIIEECKAKKISHHEIKGDQLYAYFKNCFDTITKGEPLEKLHVIHIKSICDDIIKDLTDSYCKEYKNFANKNINLSYLEALASIITFTPERIELLEEAHKEFLIKSKLTGNLYIEHSGSLTLQLEKAFNNVDEMSYKNLSEKTIRLLDYYYCKTMSGFAHRKFLSYLITTDKKLNAKHKSIMSKVKEEFGNLDEDSINWCNSHLENKLLFLISNHKKIRKEGWIKVAGTGVIIACSGASMVYGIASAVSAVGAAGRAAATAAAGAVGRAATSSTALTGIAVASASVGAGAGVGAGIAKSGAFVLSGVTGVFKGVTDISDVKKNTKEPEPEIIFTYVLKALILLLKNYISVGGKISDLIIDEEMPTL